MKGCIRLVFALMICLVVAGLQSTLAQQDTSGVAYRQWWEERHPGQPINSEQAEEMPLVTVEGNKFIGPGGNRVMFRGVSISDPDKIENQGHWDKSYFEQVKSMGANIVRIPVHPVAWRERTPPGYLMLLDQAVQWCTELDMHVIIDWHSIGNLKMELFQDPMYKTTKRETYEFWGTIARHFSGHNTVAFYELFNEPTLYRNQLGRMSWTEWKEINENMISVIRGYDTETIPLVAGLDWGYDLTPLRYAPVEAEGIGYVSHPYPHKREQPWVPKWEEAFGFAAAQYPVIVTEFGFTLGNESVAENGEYGQTIIEYLERKGISWVAWVFDPEWYPSLFRSWETYTLTESGRFFKAAMQGKIPD